MESVEGRADDTVKACRSWGLDSIASTPAKGSVPKVVLPVVNGKDLGGEPRCKLNPVSDRGLAESQKLSNLPAIPLGTATAEAVIGEGGSRET